MTRRLAACLCLCAIALLIPATHSAAEEPATMPASAPAATGVRQTWSANIQAPPEGEDAELKEAIRRLNSLCSPMPEAARASRIAKVAPASQPAASTQPAEAASQPVVDEEAAFAKLAEATDVSAADPAKLADTLFLGGRYDLAERFYAKALQAETDPQEQAWQLFQTGNCQMRTDPQAAMKTYGRLLQEHPDSLWCTVAQTRRQFIDWREKSGLTALLAQAEQKGSQ